MVYSFLLKNYEFLTNSNLDFLFCEVYTILRIKQIDKIEEECVTKTQAKGDTP